jgi:hypothetical protein
MAKAAPTPELAKSFLQGIRVYDVANIATVEIIPKFKFLLYTIPDSVWNHYAQIYDSASLARIIEEEFLYSFQKEDYSQLKQLAEQLLKDYQSDEVSAFEYFTSKMDSLSLLVKRADSLLDLSNPNPKELSQKDHPKVEIIVADKDTFKIAFDSLSEFYRYFADSILARNPSFSVPPDTVFYNLRQEAQRIYRLIDSIYKHIEAKNYFKEFELSLRNFSEYLNLLSRGINLYKEYFEKYSKLWKEYLDLYKEYLNEHTPEGKDQRKSLEKKYKLKMEELEKEFNKMQQRINKDLKELEQEMEKLKKRNQSQLKQNKEKVFDDTTDKESLNYHNLAQLVEKYNKFVNKLIYMKKQIEMEILKDLQEKGYINVEVPQN